MASAAAADDDEQAQSSTVNIEIPSKIGLAIWSKGPKTCGHTPVLCQRPSGIARRPNRPRRLRGIVVVCDLLQFFLENGLVTDLQDSDLVIMRQRMGMSLGRPVDEVALKEYQEYIEATLKCPLPDNIDFGCKIWGWDGFSHNQLRRFMCSLNECSNVQSIIMYGSAFAHGDGATFVEFVQALQRHSRLHKIVLKCNLWCVVMVKRTLCVSDRALQIADLNGMFLQLYLRWSA